MCIAVFKRKGVDLPSEEILRNCFDANSDGAGFAFAYEGKVYIKKGFMSFDNFMDAFKYNDSQYHFKDLGVLMHFRIATHGARDATMTHPFPIECDDGALKKSEYISDYAVIHNGIISLTSGYSRSSLGLSDTADFIKQYLYLIAQNRGWFNRPCNLEMIERLIGAANKMAILNNKGEILYTRGFTEDSGIFYSNTSYKYSFTRYGKHYTKNANNKYDTAYNSYDDYCGANWSNYRGYSPNESNYEKNSPTGTTNILAKPIGLMEATVGQTVMLDGGFHELVEDNGSGTMLIDKNGDVYITDDVSQFPKSDKASTYIYYYMLGNSGKILNETGHEIPFKETRWAYPDQFPEK